MPIDAEGKEYFYTSGPDGVPVVNYGAPPAASQQTTGQQLTSLLAKYNPLMLRKSLQDASGTIAMGGVLPAVAPWSAGIQNVAAQPGILYRKYLGDEKSLQEAADIEKNLPTAEQLMQKYGQAIAPKTELGQEMVEGVGKTLQRLKVPDAWPIVPNTPRRPILTPEDVRVAAGQVKQTAREVRDVPTDFQNAQSGLKRQNLYGEDTLGAKLQAAADSVGDTLERRRAAGSSALAGIPDVLQPPSAMYAMRPGGTKITRPTVPTSAGDYRPMHSAVNDIVTDVFGENVPVPEKQVATLTAEYGKRFLDPSRAATALVKSALANFEAKKIQEMYPDASSPNAAQQMFDTEFMNPEAKAKKKSEMLEEFMASPESLPIKQQHAALKFLDSAPGKKAIQQFNIDQFVQTPEGAEIAAKGKTKLAEFLKTPAGKQVLYQDSSAEFLETPAGQKIKEQITLPSFSEFTDRYKEAERVLKGPLSNFLASDIGAEKSKTVALAREGIVPGTLEDVEHLEQFADRPSLARIRTAAGYPAMGTYYDDRTAALYKRDQLAREIEDLDTQLQPLRQQATEQGVLPEQVEGYADLNKQIRKKQAEAEKNKRDIDNLKLAIAMEDVTDSAVRAKSTEEMKQSIPEKEYPFFPSVTKAKPEETHYVAIDRVLRDLGFGDLAKSLQEDILQGNLGDTKNLSIEKYMRQKHGEREFEKQFEQDKLDRYVFQVQNKLKQRLDSDPSVKRIGNAAFIESTKDTPKDVALADASAATAVLDHCVGEGGSPNKEEFHPFTGRKRIQYVPIIDPLTGQRSAGVSPNRSTSYVDGLKYGSELVHVIDPQTGLPKGTLQLEKLSDRGFTLGYTSGAFNGAIDPTFVPAIRNYLNSRADEIASAGSNLADKTGIYDTRDAQGFRSAVRAAKLTDADRLVLASMPNLPRFLTPEDLKRIYETDAPAVPTEVAVRNEAPVVSLSEDDYPGIVTDYQSALDNAAQDALENSGTINPDHVERHVYNIAEDVFRDHLNDMEGFLSEPNARLLRAERDLENHIARLHAQGTEYHGEVADALDNFLIDVRGIRGNVERRLRMAEERAAANQVEARLAQAPAQVQGDAMPNLSADELLQAHGDRMTREQQQWLEAFNRNWENNVDATPAGDRLADQMSRLYQEWRQSNTLGPDPLANLFADMEPDNTHPANNVALQVSPERQNELYRNYVDNFNRDMREGLIEEEWSPDELAEFIRGDDDVGTLNVTQAEREALARLVEDYGLRDDFDPVAQARNEVAQQRSPESIRLANDYASLQEGLQNDARNGVLDLDLIEVNELLDAIRDPHPGSSYYTMPLEARRRLADYVQVHGFTDPFQEPGPQLPAPQVANIDRVPREVQEMTAQDLLSGLTYGEQRRAGDIARQMFNGNAFGGDTPISAATYMLRNYAEGLAEGANNYVREQAARNLEQMYTAAQHDADQIAETLREAFYEDAAGPEDAITLIERDIAMLRNRGEATWEDLVGPMAEDMPWNPTVQQMVIDNLETIRDQFRGQLGGFDEPPTRRGPFQPGGSSAVRGRPLGNLNIQPAINAAALRGPDTQPVGNFLQQVKNIPGVTQEGLATGLMAFEGMDPTRRMTKAEFVRELLPSSYDIVDLKGTASRDEHLYDEAEAFFDTDAKTIARELGVEDPREQEAVSKAIISQYNDYDSFPPKVRRILRAAGIENADDYSLFYDSAYENALEEYVRSRTGQGQESTERATYTYNKYQRLVNTNEGDVYGEFGVAHPDQQEPYPHFDKAQGVMGHFRGTHNPADPIKLSTFGGNLTPERMQQLNKAFKKAFNNEELTDNDKLENLQKLAKKRDFTPADAHYLKKYIDDNMETAFEWTDEEMLDQMREIADDRLEQANVETKPNSYVIEEIQSDSQKGKKQEAHLHQAHGTLFKAAVQKGLELGADTIYLPTAEVIARARHDKASRFSPIYDKAIVKEGLNPLLKIPGVTVKMFHGYREISFTPEAKEYILNGPGQTVPGYSMGGSVRKPEINLRKISGNPDLVDAAYKYGGYVA